MEGYYEAFLGDEVAGKVQVLRQGLYYRIQCRCLVPKDMIYRLFAVSEIGRENLGVVVPADDGFILDKKVPVKRISENVQFVLSARTDADSGKFVPVYPEEPFAYIEKLQTAFLEIRNGRVGVRLRENPGAD